ncbi:MAG TPA: PDZ domain-containing protein [Nocardioides sp.]|uniref:YlbL family protein n=1 Tax=Nocardioides sp. TaxID=35761 RepID=UPI002E31A288|nr:PDZ domain-containing protein [Nocardioides sp.]HEX5087186.1 PDZ domain-containing protein [Nocardioides sp.]
MNQRTPAAAAAVVLVAALAVVALLKPLPYTTYAPGPTIDVLGAPDGKEIIQVGGDQKTYRDDGQLRMTTVSVTPKDSNLNLFEVMAAWLNRNDAVYPKDAVYPDDKTADEVRDEGQVQMVSSQDTAVAVAEKALGYPVTPSLEVTLISDGSPADGALAVRDLIRKVNGVPLSDDISKASDELRSAIKATPPGQQVTLTVLRDGKEVDVPLTPEQPSTDLFGVVKVTGSPQLGIFLGQGFILPFPVTVTIDPRIGGPSAGLMFSLAIYDTLTPGPLTGGGRVAGTGEIAADGTVGAIGGIQQKIVGAREDGAQLFLVPADNCDDAKGAHNGDMRLVKVDTFDTARSAIETWAKDHDAKLPSC